MEVAFEAEDDLFFADLNRQISLLIMDDEDLHQPPPASSPLSLQESLQRLNHKLEGLSDGKQGSGEVPPQRRESKGTGVFIPRSVEPRRRRESQRSKRFASHSSKCFFHSHSPLPSMPKYT